MIIVGLLVLTLFYAFYVPSCSYSFISFLPPHFLSLTLRPSLPPSLHFPPSLHPSLRNSLLNSLSIQPFFPQFILLHPLPPIHSYCTSALPPSYPYAEVTLLFSLSPAVLSSFPPAIYLFP